MSSYKEHCDECREKLGYDFYQVHRWLDETAKYFWPYKYHRAVRHHKGGVEQVRRMWGDDAAKAAELHILADLREDKFPADKIPSEKQMEKFYNIKLSSLNEEIGDHEEIKKIIDRFGAEKVLDKLARDLETKNYRNPQKRESRLIYDLQNALSRYRTTK